MNPHGGARTTPGAGWYLILALLSLLYAAVEIVPGRFPVTDEVFFKSAGRNWAATGNFAAPELDGRLDEGPPLSTIYFAQPPVYTFAFALYTKLVGFGPRRCISFDVLIHLALVWTALLVGLQLFNLPLKVAMCSAALMLPLGDVGRPDEMGIVLAFAAALVFNAGATARAGILLGVCGAMSLGAFFFLACPAVFAVGCRKSTWIVLSKLYVMAALTGLACVSPLLIFIRPHIGNSWRTLVSSQPS